MKARNAVLGGATALLLAIGGTVGLASAASATENPAPQYAVIIWSMEPSGETPDFDPDQTIVDSVVGLSTPDLNYFDSLLVGKCIAFQIDVYKYNVYDYSKDQVDYLISHGVLSSPGNPAEPLISGGQGTAWKFYVNTDCGPELVTPEAPSFVDACGPADEGSYTLTVPANTEAVTYTSEADTDLNRVRVIAVANEGFALSSGEDKDVWQFEYTDELCPVVEEPPVDTPPVETPPADQLAATGANPVGLAAALAMIISGVGIGLFRKFRTN